MAERLRDARIAAMARDGAVTFVVSADGRSFGAGALAQSPAGVAVTASGGRDGRIAFFGDGTSTGGVVRVRAARRVIDVTVAPLSGSVRIAPS